MSQIPWNLYPRPQLQHDSFFCLNGEWEFHNTPLIVDNSAQLSSGNGLPASAAIPNEFAGKRILLHFGAVDQIADIYWNGIPRLCLNGKPFFLSEFGGYCYAVEGHLYDPDKFYGYRNFKSQEAFIDALEALYLEQIVPLVKEGLCASVYTQVSDVEEEINGLFTYDREVLKVDENRMLAIATRLFENIR